MLTAQQKMDFVHKQTKLALEHVQHFDAGGPVLNGPSTVGNTAAAAPGTQGIAGGIGNFLGTNNNYTPQGAIIQQGTNAGQLNQAYQGAQGALNKSNQLTNLLGPQAGQGAQSQNILTNELQQRAAGQGPNPAENALNQNTAQNIAQAAALAASTRGAGANPGLIAQNAANTAANTQQNAVGQAATLEAEQQIAAQNQLQGLAGQQIGQTTNAVGLGNQAQQNEQNILQGANTAANNAAVSQQENVNNVNAQIAAGNQNANQNILGGIGSALGGIGGFLIGGPAGAAIGSKAGSLFAEGGKVPKHLHEIAKIYYPQHFYEGGYPYQMNTPVSSEINPGANPNLPTYGRRQSKDLTAEDLTNPPAQADAGTNPTGVGGTYGLGGQGMVNELGAQNPYGAAPLTSESFQMPSMGTQSAPSGPSLGIGGAYGGKIDSKLKKGGKVPGTPKENHNSYSNDTVDAKLSPGEVVIDINTLKRKDEIGKMARFVAKNIERKKMGRAV